MKITIDDTVSVKHGMTLSEVLLALAFREMKDNDIHNMLNREIIVRRANKYLVTQHWSEVVDEIICDSKGITRSDDELLELSEKMRELFPAGKMRGTPYYYRCNNAEVVRKLKKFFTQYGNYSDEDILDATKRYIIECNRTSTQIKLIKYFISKEERGKEEGTGSLLLSYLDNKESDDTINSDDWTSQLV